VLVFEPVVANLAVSVAEVELVAIGAEWPTAARTWIGRPIRPQCLLAKALVKRPVAALGRRAAVDAAAPAVLSGPRAAGL
jgi:hypothetical protein